MEFLSGRLSKKREPLANCPNKLPNVGTRDNWMMGSISIRNLRPSFVMGLTGIIDRGIFSDELGLLKGIYLHRRKGEMTMNFPNDGRKVIRWTERKCKGGYKIRWLTKSGIIVIIIFVVSL